MEPLVERRTGFVAYERFNLPLGEGWHYGLGFLQLFRLGMIAARSATTFLTAVPVHVGVDSADYDVAASLLPSLLAHPQHHAREVLLGGGFIGQELEAVEVGFDGSGGGVLEVLTLTDELLDTGHGLA